MQAIPQGVNSNWKTATTLEPNGSAVDKNARAGAAAIEYNVVLAGTMVPIGVKEEEEEVG